VPYACTSQVLGLAARPWVGANGPQPARRSTGLSATCAKDQVMVLSRSRLRAALPVAPNRALE
jgi:hypothetical protein